MHTHSTYCIRITLPVQSSYESGQAKTRARCYRNYDIYVYNMIDILLDKEVIWQINVVYGIEKIRCSSLRKLLFQMQEDKVETNSSYS